MIVTWTLFAQTSAPSSDNTEHPAASCVVAGRVVTAAEGNPLKSARVVLVPEQSGSRRQPYAIASDGDGRFILKDVVPGRYQFFATRPGFLEQKYQAKGIDGGAVLSLKPGEKVSDVLFRMTLAAVVTGRVTNEEGEAMPRVNVLALRAPSEEEIEDEGRFAHRKPELWPVAAAQTDDRGQYRIFGLKPGEYYVRVTESFEPDRNVMADQSWIRELLGSEYAAVYYPGVAQLSQAQMVSVRAGDEVQTDVSMQRVKTVQVAGQVIGPNGPAKNASVSLEQPGVVDVDHQDTTDEKGNFRLRGVPPGSYVFVVYQRGDGDTYGPSAWQKVEIGDENIDSLTVFLGGGTNFQGRVSVAGLGSVTLDRMRVMLLSIDQDTQFWHGRVKKDGTFEIMSVRDGDYAISINGLEDGWYIKSVRLGSDDIFEKGLQLEKGGSSGRLEVTLSSGCAQLEGSVSDHDGAVIGARVRVAPDPETPYNRSRSQGTTTDQTGHFSFNRLPPGSYRVLAKSPVSSDGTSHKSEPQDVTLSEHDHKTVQLTMVSAGSLPAQ
jgi:protocatechuate 3,4-dioxygenase beta subunit